MKYCRKYSPRKPAAIIPILFALVCALAVGGVCFVAFEFMYSAKALRGERAEVKEESARDAVRQAVAPAVEGAGAGGFAGIPAVIEANWGQFGREVQFVSRGAGYAVEFDGKGLEVAARGSGGVGESRIGIEFVGAGEGAGGIAWKGREELRGRVNYLVGRGADWRADVPLFASVEAKGIFAGVDCVTKIGAESGAATVPEFDLTVAPHADAREVRMRVTGAERVSVDAAGNLILRSRAGTVRLAKPRTYQESEERGDSAQRLVEARYVLEGRDVVGVRVGTYDRNLPLVIDPTISVSYVTFLGGAGSEQAFGVAEGPSGKVYVSGSTTQANFSALSGSAEGAGGGASDFFVAEIDPTKAGAASLVYLTFIGGSGSETGGKLAVNASGEAALVGLTTSSDYPVTDATRRTSGANDLAISVLGAAGNSFEFSTLLGGSGAEGLNGTPAVAFDPQGNVVVAADTTSTDLGVSVGAYATAYGGGNSEGMLAVYGPAGTLGYLTYFGINAQVAVTGVAEDLLGQAYVTGYTSQPVSGSFVKNGFQSAYKGGPFDGFVICVAPNGLGTTDLKFGTYLGGSAADEPLAVAVDNTIPATVYVTGLTESADFPTVGSAGAGLQTKLNSPINGFVTAIAQTPAGVTSLVYSTYLGGSAQLGDTLTAITALGPDAVYVAGRANSADFPVLSSLQSFSGTSDAVVAKLDTTQAGAGSLIYSSYLGGRNNAIANGVAATSSGSVFVAGTSSSPDFPLAGNPQNGAQPVCASCSETPAVADAFVVAITKTATAAPIVEFNANQLNFGNENVGTVYGSQGAVIQNVGTVPLSISNESVVGVNASDFAISSTQCSATGETPPILQPGASCQFQVVFSPTLAGHESAALSFADNASGSPQTVNLVGTGQEPLAVVSPDVLAFGDQPVGGTSLQRSINVQNPGNLTLIISNLESPTGPFQITQPTTCNTGAKGSVLPNSSCVISVTFTPQATGAFTIPLPIGDNSGNDPNSMQTVVLTGTGIPPSPIVTLTPAALSFGFQIFDTQSGPQPVTLTNSGTLALQISGIALSGAQPGDFVVGAGSTCPAAGGTLGAASSCVMNMVFAPSQTGQRTAVVSVVDNAPGSPQQVSLSGVGTSAALSVNSTALAFAPQTLAVATAAQSATVRNTGGSAIQISGITVSGANAGDFQESSNCPLTINAGASCAVNAVFAPTGGGSRSAAIFVADNAPGSPQVIALSGTGLVPGVQLGAASAAFSPEIVGEASAAKTVNLQNEGNGGLVISGVALTGVNAADFSASSNCGKTLAPGGACGVQIVFKPTAPGSREAVVEVADNALDSPQSVQVSGAGTDFEIGAAGSGGLAEAVSAGDTAKYELQVTPEGGFKGQVELECEGAPAETSCEVSPGMVNVSGSGQAGFTVSVKTQGTAAVPGAERVRRDWWGGGVVVVVAMWLVVMAWFSGGREEVGRRRVLVGAFGCVVILGVVLAVAGCGGGSVDSSGGGPPSSVDTPTPAGSYTLTVTGSSGGVSRKVSLTLAVQ